MKKIYRYSAIYALALTFALKTSSCSDFFAGRTYGIF